MISNLDKKRYISFCRDNFVPIFSQPWWLDAAAGEEKWDVLLSEKQENIVASWPLCFEQNKKGFKQVITQPKHTPFLGPSIQYPDQINEKKKINFEIEVIEEMIASIPENSHFKQGFHHSFKNWLPLYWNAFQQTTYYTYIIKDIRDVDKVKSDFSRIRKRLIKKSEQDLEVKEDMNVEAFYSFHKKTLLQKDKRISYSFTHLENIISAAYKNNAGKTLFAIDNQNRVHAAVFFIWDEESAYYLISANDTTLEKGGLTFLVWEAIKWVSNKTKAFDCEGSMIREVESVFRSFGAIQTPYYRISKSNSRIYESLRLLKKIWA